MEFSEIFELAEDYLKSRNIINIRPHEYIYLLGGCWLRMRYIVNESLTQRVLIRMRHDMLQYLYSEYQRGTHGYTDCEELLNQLILPYITLEISNEVYTFPQLEKKMKLPEPLLTKGYF